LGGALKEVPLGGALKEVPLGGSGLREQVSRISLRFIRATLAADSTQRRMVALAFLVMMMTETIGSVIRFGDWVIG